MEKKLLTKSFPCKCGRKYSRLATLTYHQKWECGKLMCMDCKKRFKNLKTYQKHLAGRCKAIRKFEMEQYEQHF